MMPVLPCSCGKQPEVKRIKSRNKHGETTYHYRVVCECGKHTGTWYSQDFATRFWNKKALKEKFK